MTVREVIERSSDATVTSIRWLDSLGRGDVGVAGGKGANLGELTGAGFPVPPGFVVGAEAYLSSMEAAGVREELAAPAGDASTWATCSDERQALVRKAGMRADVREATERAYAQLAVRLGEEAPAVAVRSSATAEDAADTSFAGMNKTFTNVRGADAVRRCGRGGVGVALRRAGRGLPGRPSHHRASRPSPSSCRPWCRRPHRAWRSPPTRSAASGRRIVIEGAFGQGEVVVGGRVEPDTYVVDRHHAARSWTSASASSPTRSSAGADGDVSVDARAPRRRRRGCSRPRPSWRWRGWLARSRPTTASPRTSSGASTPPATLHIVQTRPITTLGAAPRRPPAAAAGQLLVRGARRVAGRRQRARPGCCASRPRDARSLDGEVLVAPMTNPDWLPTMRRAPRCRDRRRRHHLPRGDRQPRARASRASSARARPPRTIRTGRDRDRRRREPGWCWPGTPRPTTGGGHRPAPAACRERRAARDGDAPLRQPGPGREGRAGRPPWRWTAWACCGPSSW